MLNEQRRESEFDMTCIISGIPDTKIMKKSFRGEISGSNGESKQTCYDFFPFWLRVPQFDFEEAELILLYMLLLTFD